MRRLAAVICLALAGSLAIPLPARAASVEWTRSVGGPGTEPFGVTIDPRDGTVFVALSDHNDLGPEYMWAIDPNGPYPYDPPTIPIPRFQLPHTQVMSVLDLGLDRLFVAMTGGIATVDPHTHALLSTVPLSGTPIGLALDASTHRVFVATQSGAAIVDGATGTVLATRSSLGPSDAWWQVAHDATRHRVYVANGNISGSPSLVVLDDTDLSLVANVALPAIPRLALAVDAPRGLVYVGGFASGSSSFGSVYTVNETTLEVTKSLDVGNGVATPFSFTVDTATDTLLVSAVANASGAPGNALISLDLATFSVRERLPLSFQPGQSALGPDGRLYVSAYDTGALAAVKLENSAPVIDSWTMSTLSPRTNDSVTTTVTAHDPDGDPLTVSYQWWVNTTNTAGQQQPIPGATSPTLDLSEPGHGDVNDLLCLSIDVSDGWLHTRNLWCFAFVVDTAPTAGVTISETNPLTNATLHATAAGNDVDRTPLTYTYTWSVNGVTRRVLTTSATADAFDLAAASDGDRGDAVSVSVVASDGTLSSAAATATVTVANTAPAVSLALAPSAPRSSDTLVATARGSDADQDALTYTYTWMVSKKVKQVVVTTSTTSSFTMRSLQAQTGDTVTVTVTASDGVASSTAASATVTVGKN